MNGKTLIPLAAGLGIGGFALWMGFNTLRNARGAQQAPTEIPLWSPKTDVPRGTEITEEMLQPLQFPASLLPPGAVQHKQDLVGRVPRLDLAAGLPILDELLLPAGARAGIFVRAGFRAVAVKIDEGSGVDYHLEPGAYVDVVGSFNVQRNGRQEMCAQTIVENVEIAAVGPRLSFVGKEESGGKNQGARENRLVRAVTLFVKPEDVPKLLLTEQQGHLKLSLRGGGDSAEVGSRRTVSDQELTGTEPDSAPKSGAGAPSLLERLRGLFTKPQSTPPATAAAAPVAARPVLDLTWAVAVCRGTGREMVHFKNRDSCERVEPEDQDSNRSIFGPPKRTAPPRDATEAGEPKPKPETPGTDEPGAAPKEPQE
jgi:pilus assembly protein CpaB